MKYKFQLTIFGLLLLFNRSTFSQENKLIVSNIKNCSVLSTAILQEDGDTIGEIEAIQNGAKNGNPEDMYILYLKTKEKYPKNAICWLQNLANTDEVKYHLELAYNLAAGDKSILNIPAAINLYSEVLSKEPNNIAANLSLGAFYSKGYGVTKNERQAFEYFLKASNQINANSPNYSKALLKVGTAYHYGIGTKVNQQEALMYYQSILTRNYEEPLIVPTRLTTSEQFLAQAQMYETGLGGVKDIKKATDNYYLAATEGNSAAQYKMSKLYEEGQGVPKDTDNANAWLETAKLNDTIEAYYF